MNAEMETTEAIINHYEELKVTISEKTKTLSNRIKQFEATTPNYQDKVRSVEQPIEVMQDKLKQKRDSKLQHFETHIQRTEKYVKKEKQPQQRLTNTQQGHQRRRYQSTRTPTHANATANRYQQVYNPQPPNQRTPPDLNLVELITNIVRHAIAEIIPHQNSSQNILATWRT